MYTSKQFFTRAAFLAEVCAFLAIYLYGSHGLQSVRGLEQENALLEMETAHATQQVTRLQEEIASWHRDDFRKEKIAREQLQLARPGDEIYYTS